MTQYTPEEIALARKVVADHFERADLLDKTGIRMVLDGQFDHWSEIQLALAAIRATTERAAKLLDGDGGKVIPLLSAFAPLVSGNNMPCMSGDARDRLRPHVRQRFDDRIASVAAALRANEHLKDRPDAG